MTLIRERVRHELAVRRASVAHVTDVTPRMRRVTLTGDELVGFASLGPADHVKLFFPDPVTGELVAPVVDPEGRMTQPSTATPIARDFTPAGFRPDAAELDLDFFRHPDGGPAARWAEGAAAGARLAVAGPRGSLLPPEGIDRAVLVGDETALPAIRRWLRMLPEQVEVTALLTATDVSTRSYFEGGLAARAELVWFAPSDTVGLEQALRALGPLPGTAFAFLAGNAETVAPLRRYLRRELELPRAQVQASGYWRPGVVALDHHAPVDPSDPD
ncbi:MAG TPA: siderophore-interacting protein [Gryllotalpicola sp.]